MGFWPAQLAEYVGFVVVVHELYGVVIGQELFGGAIGVYIYAKVQAGLETAGPVPNGGSTGKAVCQEVVNDLVVAEKAAISGPGPRALTSLGDDGIGEAESEQALIVR